MNGYTFIVFLVIIILIIRIFKKQNNEDYTNCPCSFKDSLNNHSIDNKNCDTKSCYARNVDKNIVVSHRFLSGQSDSILGHEESYPNQSHAGIYNIGEIDLFNNPRIPLGHNSSGRLNNNDYNINISV
jgi:hypothetical protein